MDRNIGEVLDRVLAKIPYTEVTFIMSLEHLKKDLMYTAPEVIYLRWDQFAAIINTHLLQDYHALKPWEKEVADIFTAKK